MGALRRKAASLEGSLVWTSGKVLGCDARSKGQLATPLRTGDWKALAWANGTSREIDCEAIGG